MDDEEKDPEYNYLAEVDDLIDSDEELRDDRAVKISSQFVILVYLLWKAHQFAKLISICFFNEQAYYYNNIRSNEHEVCNLFAMYSNK